MRVDSCSETVQAASGHAREHVQEQRHPDTDRPQHRDEDAGGRAILHQADSGALLWVEEIREVLDGRV